MDARTFLGLEPTEDPLRWRLPITPRVCTQRGFMFGGCGLAAGIAALEAATGRPTIWAAAQYLSYAQPPSVMELTVSVAVVGHQVTQARATARVGETEILTVNAALGTRPVDAGGQWSIRPRVPPPQDCPERIRSEAPAGPDTVTARVEQRLALGRQQDDLHGLASDGRCALWARMPELLEVSAAGLAVLGDHVPFGIRNALGRPGGGRSLDNTLRVVELVPSEWVLLDIRVHAVARGFGHGLIHLWAEDGPLLATASQSAIVRV